MRQAVSLRGLVQHDSGPAGAATSTPWPGILLPASIARVPRVSYCQSPEEAGISRSHRFAPPREKI